jgi:hypothetical protein
VTTSYPRFAAAGLLFAGGALVGLFAFAVVVARVLIAVGVPVAIKPIDVALLDDLVQVMPFVGAFAAASIVAGSAILNASSWADRLARTVSAGAVSVGLLFVVLLILGQDPFAAVPSNRALDGLGILGTFAALYGAVIVALAFDGKPALRPTTQAAA